MYINASPSAQLKDFMILNKLAIAALVAAPVFSLAATINLTGKGYVTYGDANTYSLPLNGLEVLSGPGQIDMFTKLGLGANGQLGNGQSGMDNAFDTPQANNIPGFRMNAVNEPGGTEGSWDRLGWWDATLAAMNSKLNLLMNSIVFFFANNETGGGSSANLAAWARVEVSQISTNTVLGRYDMTNDVDHAGQGYGPPPAGGGVLMGNPGLFTSNGAEPFVSDFLMSGGDVCLNGVGQLVDCSGLNVVTRVQHNLGGDRAAYAIVLPEMDALIAGLASTPGANLNDFAIHVQYRLGCGLELTQAGGSFPQVLQGQSTECNASYALNGGDEKVFLGTQLLPNVVPEPGSLALVGLALAFLPILRAARSRKRAAV